MERRSILITSLVAFAIVLATDVLYGGIINAQGGTDPMPYVPRFVAGYMALMAALIAIALLPRAEIVPIRAPLRAAAAAGLLVLGFLAAFSVGPPLVIAGLLVSFAFSRTIRGARSRPARFSGLAAAFVAVAVLLAGFEVAQRVVVCPEAGQMSGGGSGFLSGPYQYECNNGVATFHSG